MYKISLMAEAQEVTLSLKKKKKTPEFLLWFSRLSTRLVSTRMWVQSLALLSGLRIWYCYKLWQRSQMQLRSRVAVADSEKDLDKSMKKP